MIGYKEIAEVSRYLDALSEEGHEFDDIVRERGIELEGLVRAAEQRAVRIGMIMEGRDPRTLPRDRMTNVTLDPRTRQFLPTLQLAYLDGFIAGRACCDPDDRIQRFPERED